MPEPLRKFAGALQKICRNRKSWIWFSAWLFGYFSDVSTVTTVSLPLYPNFLVVSIYILLFRLSPSLSFFFLSVSVHLVITDFLVVSISILLFCLSLSLSSYPVLLSQFSAKSQIKNIWWARQKIKTWKIHQLPKCTKETSIKWSEGLKEGLAGLKHIVNHFYLLSAEDLSVSLW